MPYRGNKLDVAISQPERDLLTAGRSYTEVAEITGGRIKSISERNRLVYKIDIWEAFKRRIERDGIPNRLTVGEDFGYWFSGLFDGEGSIVVFTRPHTRRPQYSEYRLAIRIQLRDDDAEVIRRIYDNLQVGRISAHKAKGRINPTVAWTVERVQDLAEVVIPLLDRYPLYSKKAKEYAIWKPIVVQRYITTMAGYSNRSGIPDHERAAFHEALQRIAEVRTYAAPTDAAHLATDSAVVTPCLVDAA